MKRTDDSTRHTAPCLLWMVMLALCGSACQGPDRAAESNKPRLWLRPAVTSDSSQQRARAHIALVEGSANAWELLSLSGSGAFVYGKPLPASRGYHGQPSFAPVKLLTTADKTPQLLSAAPLIDAVIAASGAVAMLAPHGELKLWRPNRPQLAISDEVSSGLSFSADGSKLVFAKGTAPELELHLAELGNEPANTRVLAPHPGPDYLPVLSADGQSLAFVSARSGMPALWSVPAAGGSPQQITAKGYDPHSASQLTRLSSPDGRQPPLWQQGFFVFFDGAGVAVVAERSGELVGYIERASRPHWAIAGRELVVELDGQLRTAVLPASEGSP